MREPSQEHVDALRSGNQAAWSVVVRWLQPQLDGFFASGGAADPESLTQETFLRMSRAIERFTDGGAHELRAWAFAIGRTARIDAARRASVRPDTIPDSERDPGDSRAAANQADDGVAFEDDIASSSFIADALGHLTEQQAELLRLRILGDMTMESASQVLGMSLGAAKQLERRALRRLQTVLADPDAPDELEDEPRDERDARWSQPPSGTPP